MARFNSIEQLFTEEYAGKYLLPSILAALLAAYAVYTTAKGTTYRKARDKIDDTVQMFCSSALAPLLNSLSASYNLGPFAGMMIAVVADPGDYVSEALVPIPSGKTETDVIGDDVAIIVAALFGVLTFAALYVGVDLLRQLLPGYSNGGVPA